MSKPNTIIAANVLTGALGFQASGTTFNLAYPAGLRRDDVIAIFGSSFNTAAGPTNPSMTQDDQRGIAANTAAPWDLMAHRKATAADVTASAAATTLAVTVPNNALWIIMVAIREVDLLTMLDAAVSSVEPNATQSNCPIPGQTTTRPGCGVLTGATNVSTGNTWTAPTLDSVLMTELSDIGGATRSAEVCFGLSGVPGATGTLTATSSGTGKNEGAALFFRPRPPLSAFVLAA